MVRKRESRTALARGRRAIVVEFTPEQKEQIEDFSDDDGMKPAQFIRHITLTEIKKRLRNSSKTP